MSTLTDDQIRERNAAAVRRLYQCDRERDIETWSTLWHPDARATFPACNYLDPIVGRDALIEWTKPKYAVRGVMDIREEILPLVNPAQILARVGLAIEVTAGNPPFLSEIWVLFTFDDDGLMLEHAEMFDSAQYRDILLGPTSPGLPMNIKPEALPTTA